jgi:FkbM family methyltransferase
MRAFKLQQVRETLVRYVREQNLAAGRTPGRATEPNLIPGAVLKTVAAPTRLERMKKFLRGVPLLAPLLVTGYRLIKLPGRVALIVRQLQIIQEQQSALAQLHGRIDALSWQMSALQERQEAAVQAFESVAKQTQLSAQEIDDVRVWGHQVRENVGALRAEIVSPLHDLVSSQHVTTRSLAEAADVLVALHEKKDRYQQELRSMFGAINPIICAGDNLVISRVGDFIMAFPAEEWRLPAYQILRGQLEPGLYARMKSTIGEGMSVIDIGANVGTYTLLALQLIGPSGRVISYEPTPRVFDILKNNIQVNGYLETGCVDLRAKAVSDKHQPRIPFFVHRYALTHSSLYDGEGRAADTSAIEVETVSLDEDLDQDVAVDVVKIDAEGAEPMILRGMRRIIERSPAITIFIEFAPSHLKRAGVDIRAFLADIRAQEFEILEVSEPTGELRSVTDEQLYNCFSLNLRLRRAAQE